jgi:hypothetical protein
MRCNIKQHKPLTPYQQKKFEAEIGFRTFQHVLGLTAMVLDTQGATKVQIQEVINGILNQYECLTAGNITMDDIHNYLAEYGISVEDGTLYSSRTKYDEQMDALKLEGE